jgi:hypothetical protein
MDLKDIKHSVPEAKKYARSHLSELFAIAAILVASLSAKQGYFWGTAGWSFFIFSIAMAVSILLPHYADMFLSKLYGWMTHRDRTKEIIIGAIKIAIALIAPWIIFAMIGILAGEAYHYYTRPHRDSGSNHRAA